MIPVSRPMLGQEELEYVSDAVSSGWISSVGKYVSDFEHLFASYCGVKHCISVSNGTVGIHLLLVALRIGKGDEVIVPDLTFVATANAVRMAGAEPVIADVARDSWCIDPADVEQKISERTRAIMPVHLYGHPADMGALRGIAERHSVRLIEDAAEAHGAMYEGSRVGSLGHAGVFSFYGNKIVTTGEGGAITTDSDDLAERLRFLRDHAMSNEIRYWHTEVGFNYRMANLQAAVGVAQMGRIEAFLAARDEILETYRYYLKHESFHLNPRVGETRPVNWMTSLLMDGVDRARRDAIIQELRRSGIDSRPFFFPLSMLPMYQCERCEVAADLSERGLNLPTYVGLSEEEIRRISECVTKIFENERHR